MGTYRYARIISLLPFTWVLSLQLDFYAWTLVVAHLFIGTFICRKIYFSWWCPKMGKVMVIPTSSPFSPPCRRGGHSIFIHIWWWMKQLTWHICRCYFPLYLISIGSYWMGSLNGLGYDIIFMLIYNCTLPPQALEKRLPIPSSSARKLSQSGWKRIDWSWIWGSWSCCWHIGSSDTDGVTPWRPTTIHRMVCNSGVFLYSQLSLD